MRALSRSETRQGQARASVASRLPLLQKNIAVLPARRYAPPSRARLGETKTNLSPRSVAMALKVVLVLDDQVGEETLRCMDRPTPHAASGRGRVAVRPRECLSPGVRAEMVMAARSATRCTRVSIQLSVDRSCYTQFTHRELLSSPPRGKGEKVGPSPVRSCFLPLCALLLFSLLDVA